jgi:hypothetical protein
MEVQYRWLRPDSLSSAGGHPREEKTKEIDNTSSLKSKIIMQSLLGV